MLQIDDEKAALTTEIAAKQEEVKKIHADLVNASPMEKFFFSFLFFECLLCAQF